MDFPQHFVANVSQEQFVFESHHNLRRLSPVSHPAWLFLFGSLLSPEYIELELHTV